MMKKIMVMQLKESIILTNFFQRKFQRHSQSEKRGSITLKYSLIIFISFLSSCSSYINYLESSNSNERKQYFTKEEETQKFCTENKDINIIYDSQKQVLEFKSITKSVKDHISKNINLVDMGLLYTLYQSLIRPDASNWNGRFQFMIKHKGQFSYFDFHSDELNFPMAIQTLKNKKISKYNLRELIQMAKKTFPSKLTVHEKFSEYLEGIKEDLSEKQRRKYLRLGKSLQKGETFSYLLKQSRKTKYSHYTPAPLFEKNLKESKATCNFDIGLYDSGVFLIRDQEVRENVFALTSDNGEYFIAATSAGDITEIKSPLYLSKVEKNEFNIPYCRYSDAQKEQLFVAFGQRDSGQILDHLFDYGIHNSRSIYETSEYINYARHIFLTNPSRLLYESQRGTQEEMNSFLALDFPVYHVKNLGNVYSFLTFQDKPPLFLKDIRVEAAQSCLK